MGKIARLKQERKARRANGGEDGVFDSGEPPAADLAMPRVPGPTGNSAANLLIVDIVVRMGTLLLRTGVESALLKRAVGRQGAATIARKRNLPQQAASIAIARIGTSSLPGAAVVGIGLAAATIYQRRRADRFERALGKLRLLGKGERAG